MRTAQAPYLERLDHLRLLAAALVVCFHWFHRFIPDLRPTSGWPASPPVPVVK